jgi:thiamine pyrophosphokinase
MSSHHIVKEDQEPALLIADADAVSFDIVQQLLEWSPTVVVLANALEKVLGWGIKLDVVLASSERVSAYMEVLKNQMPVKILFHGPGDDPLSTAMMFFTAGKYKAVNIVGSIPELSDDFTGQLDLVCFHSGKRWSYIRKGRYEKWLTKGTQLTFSDKKVKVDGLNESGIVYSDGLVKIQADGPFWIGEDLNAVD